MCTRVSFANEKKDDFWSQIEATNKYWMPNTRNIWQTINILITEKECQI